MCRRGIDRGLLVPTPPATPGPPSRSRPNLLEHIPQVYVELGHRGPTPVPISVVDLEDLESGLEYERVGDHRIVRLIRELLDVQILLDDPIGVGQERPRGTRASRNSLMFS